MNESLAITPHQLLAAYANGYFPMALSADDPELYWFSPEERGVIPLDGFHIPRGLRRALKARPYTVTVDQAFAAVMEGCAAPAPGREDTWINPEIRALYGELHAMGYAHSVEVWRSDDPKDRLSDDPKENFGSTDHQIIGPRLIGGLYGVSLGAAFFGESMFSRAPDASKIALVALVEILREAGYTLLDTQYVNDHLKQFGVQAVPKADYMAALAKALSASPNPSSLFSTASVRSGFASASSVSETF